MVKDTAASLESELNRSESDSRYFLQNAQARLLSELLAVRRRRTYVRVLAILGLVISQLAVFFVTFGGLFSEFKGFVSGVSPIIGVVIGYFAATAMNFFLKTNDIASNDLVKKYEMDTELKLLEELSRNKRDVMLLQEKLRETMLSSARASSS
jgi:hypothetical protein